MLAPAAMFIESAADSLHKDGDIDGTPYPAMPLALMAAELSELKSFGDARAKTIGLWDEDSNQEVMATGVSIDFQLGYLLGLQTARTILAGSMALVLKKVNPKDVL